MSEDITLNENNNVKESGSIGNRKPGYSGRFERKPFGFNNNRFGNFEKQEELSMAILSRGRISKTTAGGRQQRFAVLCAVGDKKGRLGIGSAKSLYFNDAVKKAEQRARKNIKPIRLYKGTIPHNSEAKVGSTKILLFKAKPGKGIVAGGCLWSLFDLIGIKDITCKCIGASSSNYNMTYAAVKALEGLECMAEIAKRRGKQVKDLLDYHNSFKNVLLNNNSTNKG